MRQKTTFWFTCNESRWGKSIPRASCPPGISTWVSCESWTTGQTERWQWLRSPGELLPSRDPSKINIEEHLVIRANVFWSWRRMISPSQRRGFIPLWARCVLAGCCSFSSTERSEKDSSIKLKSVATSFRLRNPPRSASSKISWSPFLFARSDGSRKMATTYQKWDPFRDGI